MKYMLLVYLDQGWEQRPLAERREIYLGQVELSQEYAAKGKYVGGSPLQPPATATAVRVREGKRLLTDGPFAETREYLGGYMVLDVDSLEEAIEYAGRSPLARVGTIEVRPLREGPPT